MTSLHTLEEGRTYNEMEDEEAQEEMPGNESMPLSTAEHDTTDVDDSSPITLPQFMQDEILARNGWKWVPTRLRKLGSAIKKWSKGPEPPKIQRIRPWFPSIQEAPLRLLDTYVPKKKNRILLLFAVYFCWILSFSLVLRESTIATEIEGYGKPTKLSCGASYWSPKNFCGLNGRE